MPQTVLSDQERILTSSAVLAYAAAQAAATNQPRVVVAGLLLYMQDVYGTALPAYRTLLGAPRLPPIGVDGAWGKQSAMALYVMLRAAVSRVDMPLFDASDIGAALDITHDQAAVNSVARLAARFPRIRDAVTTFANQQHADSFRTIIRDADGMLAVVNSSATTADVSGRARTYLGSLWRDGTQQSVPTAQVVSTRTPPSTDLLKEATQTPSTTMNVDAPPMELSVDEVDVYGRPTLRRANLAVIIPSVLVGALLLAWGVQKYQGRARR